MPATPCRPPPGNPGEPNPEPRGPQRGPHHQGFPQAHATPPPSSAKGQTAAASSSQGAQTPAPAPGSRPPPADTLPGGQAARLHAHTHTHTHRRRPSGATPEAPGGANHGNVRVIRLSAGIVGRQDVPARLGHDGRTAKRARALADTHGSPASGTPGQGPAGPSPGSEGGGAGRSRQRAGARPPPRGPADPSAPQQGGTGGQTLPTRA